MTFLFWPIAFLVIGLLLLIVEVFVPSGGFIGFSALFCVGLSLWHAFQYSTRLGAVFLVVDFAAVPMTAMLAFWLWTRAPMSRKFFLKPPAADEIDVSHSDLNLPHVVGREGRALTPLRPSGHVEIDGRRYDGLAEEGFIPEGSLVRVVRSRSGQLVVRASRRPADVDSSQLGASASAVSPTEHNASLIEDSP
jgi:membrane-bound ClpP family serine protease